MSISFKVELREWYYNFLTEDIRANLLKEFIFEQPLYRTSTIKDVKNFVQEKSLESNDPICTCFLEIRKWAENGENLLTLCKDYFDSTFLNDTIFIKNKPIVICIEKGRICKCGKYEQIKINANLIQKQKNEQKIWEQKDKENREHFNRMIENQNRQHQNELNRLQNIIYQNNNQNQRQIQIQKEQYQSQINQLQSVINEQKKENEKIEEQIKIERELNAEKFQKIKEENEQKIKNIENERNLERESNQERFKILEKTIDDKDSQIKQNTQQLLAYENQKKQKQKNEQNAENTFLNQVNLIYSNFYKNCKEMIISDFNLEMTKFFEKIIIFENKALISQICNNEKFSKNVKAVIEDKVFGLKEENLKYKISHFNILIMGNTGVGKSTLLNTVLKSELAKTCYGNACTMGIPKNYESEKAKGIRIWDTRGIENGQYNLWTANKDIKKTIKNLISEKDPDKFIHCIWYCINSNSNRFIKDEVNNLKDCYELYIEKLPIIVVLTQAFNQEDADEMIEHVKKQIKNFDENNSIKLLKVLAKPKERKNKKANGNKNVKTLGIYNLMNETLKSSKEGILSSCIDSLMDQGKLLLKEEFKICKNNLTEKYLNKKLENMNNYNFISFINYTKIFSKDIFESLIFNNKLLENTISQINALIDKKANVIKTNFEKLFEERLDNISNKLTEKLVDFVAKLDAQFKVKYLSAKYHYNELKRLAKTDLISNLKPLIENFVYKEMSKKLFEKLTEELSNLLSEVFQELLINNRGIKEIFNIKGKENAEKCYNRIKRLLMDYPKDDFEKENSDNEQD